jgi:hypothetical protein
MPEAISTALLAAALKALPHPKPEFCRSLSNPRLCWLKCGAAEAAPFQNHFLERSSLSPRWGFGVSCCLPTACAVGCTLAPLRGCCGALLIVFCFVFFALFFACLFILFSTLRESEYFLNLFCADSGFSQGLV